MNLTLAVNGFLLILIIGFIFFDWSEEAKQSGRAEATRKWVLGLSVFCFGHGLITHQLMTIGLSFFGFLYFFLSPKLIKAWLTREATLIMLNTSVETWYHDGTTNYWFNRGKNKSLLDWANENNKSPKSFDLAVLRKYGKKFHWIYLEGSSPAELPEPRCRLNAMVSPWMYKGHLEGPYEKNY